MLGHLVLTHHDDEARGGAPHTLRRMWQFLTALFARL